jgi:hypothetical protein
MYTYMKIANEACIAYSRNPVRHSTIMKHLERALYWIAVACGEIELIVTPTKIQWADIGTVPCSENSLPRSINCT